MNSYLKTLKLLLFTFTILSINSCKNNTLTNSTFVKNNTELKTAITNASPGTNIILKDGVWKDAQIKFYGIRNRSKNQLL